MSSKYSKLTENSNRSVANQNVNCLDFSECSTPDLKQLDNFLYVEYAGQRHIYPERINSAKSKDVSCLKITYFTSDHVAYLQQISNNLQRLDLSYSNLFKLPIGIFCNMNQLQVLILDNNQLTETSFCVEFSNIMGNSLKELSVCSNLLSTLPVAIENLNKLMRLKISHNLISSFKNYDKLKKLKMLSMDNNQLMQLGNGFYLMKRLENLYLSHNQLTTFSMAVKYLTHLKEIDLSYNSLRTVSSDLFLLPYLEILKLNDNKIRKLPNFKITGKLKRTISHVDLSSNLIVRFPECILKMTDDLDLSNNKIKVIPSNVLKKLLFTTSQKLILKNNPLSSPPKDVCESGLKCMIQFYQENEAVAKIYNGLKVFCLGSDKINRFNIISALSDQFEEEDLLKENMTILEMFDTAFELSEAEDSESKLLNYQFLDIFDEHNNIYWLMLFITSPALILIFVDVDGYSKDSFGASIGKWIQQIIVKQNEISFMVVGVTNGEINAKTTNILKTIKGDVKEFFKSYETRINNEIQEIESKSKIDASMSLSLKKFIDLKSVKVIFCEKCVLIKAKNVKAIKKLQEAIINMTTKTNAFKKVMNPVPRFWSDTQTYFEEESYKFPIISVNEYEIMMHQKFNLKPVALKIANFLHEIGNFLWWENSNSPLSQWIVTSQFTLVECLRILFRVDLKNYLEDMSDPDRIAKRFKKRFSKPMYSYRECCNVLFEKSILLPELIIILWENILPVKFIIRTLYYLCECWSLGYLINYPYYPVSSWIDLEKEHEEIRVDKISSIDNIEYRLKSSESPKQNTPSHEKIPCVFFPWFLSAKNFSEEANQKWDLRNNYQICVCYKFTLGLSKIILQQILVKACNQRKCQIKLTDHWTRGIQAEIENKNVLFRIYQLMIKDNEDFIKFEFRIPVNSKQLELKNDAQNYFCLIWYALLDFLIDTDQLLESYKGLWYERLIECPFCKQASFPGSWHTSNENLLNEDKTCPLCDQLVPMYILDPPKLSTNVSPSEVIKNIRNRFNRK